MLGQNENESAVEVETGAYYTAFLILKEMYILLCS